MLSNCATHEIVLSRNLSPVLSSEEIDFNVTLFRARVNKGVLEVRGRVKRKDSDYVKNLDNEINSAAALCAAIVNSEIAFKYEWRILEIQLTNEYGSQSRWKNTYGHIMVRISREMLMELKTRNAPESEYLKYWEITASKTGPPDYVPLELFSPGLKKDQEQGGF